MLKPTECVVRAANPQEIVRSATAFMPQLAPDIRSEFTKLITTYLVRYGVDGLYARVNNRSIAAILDDWGPQDRPSPRESGEVDEVRYELYDVPSSDDSKDEENR